MQQRAEEIDPPVRPVGGETPPSAPAVDISVVVPARDEAESIATVVERSFAAFERLGKSGEVLVVDDGSGDGTSAILSRLESEWPNLRSWRNRRSLGMTAALQRMFSASRGEIVILIPGDMESDPLEDVPALVSRLEQADLDVVAGWRQGRKDGKVFASAVYNWFLRTLSGVQVHDGNWIKAMRREVIDRMPPLRSDWHRFLLIFAVHEGFRIGEVATGYRPRPAGSSKFGFSRIPISLLDVLVVQFLLTFSRAPMRFFGGLGLLSLLVSLVTFLYLSGLYLLLAKQQRPLFIAAGVVAIIGVLLILVGFLAELIVSQTERIEELERALLDSNPNTKRVDRPGETETASSGGLPETPLEDSEEQS